MFMAEKIMFDINKSCRQKHGASFVLCTPAGDADIQPGWLFWKTKHTVNSEMKEVTFLARKWGLRKYPLVSMIRNHCKLNRWGHCLKSAQPPLSLLSCPWGLLAFPTLPPPSKEQQREYWSLDAGPALWHSLFSSGITKIYMLLNFFIFFPG